MGGAEHAGLFVAGANAYPEADGDGALGGHAFGDDADAAGEDGAADFVAAFALVDETAGVVVEFVGEVSGIGGEVDGHGVAFIVLGQVPDLVCQILLEGDGPILARALKLIGQI